MVSSLDQLKETGTVVVTDTGEFESISKFKPQDATTNPSLILTACKNPKYLKVVDKSIEKVFTRNIKIDIFNELEVILDQIIVEFGTEILKIVPGRVSTEVDARLSFNKEKTIEKALRLIELYENNGVSRDRILIKIASTWEGIQAARELEFKYGVHCNLTLLFSFIQAVACAEANITLISPFVGRILDWHKANGTLEDVDVDPGVESVTRIFNYYKKYGYTTIVMGASFRNIDEIKNLAGCDFLTISPNLLNVLNESDELIIKKLDSKKSVKVCNDDKVNVIDNESKFRFEFNQDQMSTEKLSEGIRKFSADTNELLEFLKQRVQEFKRVNKL
ncbi:hypothetical protein CANARDRAFT_108644 [[Candida] arabinofermentans NRRL YB-2248]|uniref:Transaldolase n=1 Tax=[Candida] arabinofermentans NRRL YB-2248 TaxID=983967 RepID=A0A1E4STH9_9ASCO|nr:hypothetical protein CANARDRAFT_108644 [[Candida] arabinofermentans NRRL YB-2248]